ncbi:ketosynthase chain-length factor [Streptomyces platensis]|uniref:ketosynthase chain-length factor n=1 Tax=Streptomyces platensis TaxID=58346 RepID=UPI0036AE37F9
MTITDAPASDRRALITGLGVLAPNGLSTEQYWESVLAGESGICELTRFDTSAYASRLAGQVRGFVAEDHLPGRLLPQTDVSTRFALAAADAALADAASGPDTFEDYAMGVVTANALGGFEFTHREFRKLWDSGPEFVSVYESFAWFYAVNTGQISIRNAMRGPGMALVSEQAGGLDALGQARRAVASGSDLMVSGGVDSALDPWGWASQLAGGRVSTVQDPDRAYLPFDAEAAGYVPGEGGALLVMEAASAARERGAPRIYGELAGHASTFDPAPGSERRRTGLVRAAEGAMAQAGVRAADIDVVFADAAGVPTLDREEAIALNALFSRRGVPVTAPKALTGRLYSGGGPLDVATALLSLRDDVVPPTPHTRQVPDEYGIDLVLDEPRHQPLSTALVLARGRWGFNSAVVVRSAEA